MIRVAIILFQLHFKYFNKKNKKSTPPSNCKLAGRKTNGITIQVKIYLLHVLGISVFTCTVHVSSHSLMFELIKPFHSDGFSHSVRWVCP